jgi:hypothetical protein
VLPVTIEVGGKAYEWVEVVGLGEGVSEVGCDWSDVALFDMVRAEGCAFVWEVVMRFEGAARFEWIMGVED